MSPPPVPTAEPSPEDFAGASATQLARRLFHATRPKFFPASVLPVLLGTAWGFKVTGHFDFVIFLLALLATTCVHAGANVLNDVGDDAGGTDRCNDERIYPYTGGSRFIQTGIMTAPDMSRLGIGLLAAAALVGLALLVVKGPIVLLFGLAGVVLAVIYSLGPLRLSAMGLGEAAVAVAFGVLPVAGASWLQSGVVNAEALLVSLPISAWVAAILLMNEVPDVVADGATGKRTLPVRLGSRGTAILYVAIHIFAAAAVLLLTAMRLLPLAAPLVPAGLLVPAVRSAAAIRLHSPPQEVMTRAIEATLGIHTLGSIWLCACVLFSVW